MEIFGVAFVEVTKSVVGWNIVNDNLFKQTYTHTHTRRVEEENNINVSRK